MMGAAMLKRHQAVPLGIIVVSSITFVRHLYVGESGAALVVETNLHVYCGDCYVSGIT